MRLELADFPVRRIQFGDRTGYSKGELIVDRDSLQKLVSDDPRIKSVDFALASPGEETRIINIHDAVEPRVKVAGQGCAFPGIMGGVERVGSGRTHRLSSMAVLGCTEMPGYESGGLDAPLGDLMDMTGPGALSPISSCQVLGLIVHMVPGYTFLDYHGALQSALFKAATYLAEVTRNQVPERVEVFELGPVDPELPKIVLVEGVAGIVHIQHPGHAYYGWYIRDALPFYIHPNELWDGAITPSVIRMGATSTWGWQNHPMMRTLYEAHGRSIDFRGVVIQRLRFETFSGKQLSGSQAAQLAKALGAEAAIVHGWMGGNSFIDSMLSVEACEKLGIKTVLVTFESCGPQGLEPPLLYSVPEAIAIVSTGSTNRPLKLPAVKKVIGGIIGDVMKFDGAAASPYLSVKGELNLSEAQAVLGASNVWGYRLDTCREH